MSKKPVDAKKQQEELKKKEAEDKKRQEEEKKTLAQGKNPSSQTTNDPKNPAQKGGAKEELKDKNGKPIKGKEGTFITDHKT